MHPRVVRSAAALVLVLAGCSAPAAPTPPVALPPPGAHVSYQLGGPYDPPDGVTVVDRDHAVDPAPGAYGICYVNAFQAETAEVDDWDPELLLHDDAGALVADEEWDEPLLDTSSPAQRTAVAEVVGGWVDECARRGYRAVELDNLDAAARSQGLLSDDDALALAALLLARAHAQGLAVAQKNAAELTGRARALGFDLAVAEECQVFDECDAYVQAYARVVEVEYTDQPRAAFDRACALRGATTSVVLRDRDVTPPGDPAHVEQFCP